MQISKRFIVSIYGTAKKTAISSTVHCALLSIHPITSDNILYIFKLASPTSCFINSFLQEPRNFELKTFCTPDTMKWAVKRNVYRRNCNYENHFTCTFPQKPPDTIAGRDLNECYTRHISHYYSNFSTTITIYAYLQTTTILDDRDKRMNDLRHWQKDK